MLLPTPLRAVARPCTSPSMDPRVQLDLGHVCGTSFSPVRFCIFIFLDAAFYLPIGRLEQWQHGNAEMMHTCCS